MVRDIGYARDIPGLPVSSIGCNRNFLLFKALNLLRMLFSFSPITSTNVKIGLKNFLTLIFKPFHSCVRFQGHNWCQSHIVGLDPIAPLKR